ncbi:hypothetical protein CDL12_23437 [Handroanthus impetiginosus]|uniref:BHLH domain-containing protein n=1 Tax=Handroanthus impetiginosus TaxID=429701 RepID=A0A2G9GFP2_9LAMI|nr:hypothetical protein CDL12_23437 [Handroanthus impetiginosus]
MSERGKGQLVKQEAEEEEIKRLLMGIMEGYNDAVIPPLSYFSPSPGISISEKGTSSVERQKYGASWAESLHKERKRREQMNEKFSVLQSMVPTLLNAFKVNSLSPCKSPFSDGVTFFAIQLPFRCRLVTDIVKVFEKHKVEVLEARVCVNEQQLLTFIATIILGSDGGSTIDKIREEVLTL